MPKFLKVFLLGNLLIKLGNALNVGNINHLNTNNINLIKSDYSINQLANNHLDNYYDISSNNQIYNQEELSKTIFPNFGTSDLLANNNFDLEQKKIDFITNNICKDRESGINLIKLISKKLPEFDSIAPKVLHLNDQIIDFALNTDVLPTFIQKKIVLFSINFAIWGDEMGSQFLKFYYDLVHHCL